MYFDGKTDVSLVSEKEGNTFFRRKVTEEHISLLMEPGGKYIGHFTSVTSRSRSILEDIVKSTKDCGVSLNSIIATGCDGTNVNTGIIGILIVMMEHNLDKQLHWLICMLHAIGLSSRHLFSNLDGETSGPCCFTGPIGKHLQNCEKRPIENFTPVKVHAIVTNATDLSTDRKHLFEMHETASSGQGSQDLGKRSPDS